MRFGALNPVWRPFLDGPDAPTAGLPDRLRHGELPSLSAGRLTCQTRRSTATVSGRLTRALDPALEAEDSPDAVSLDDQRREPRGDGGGDSGGDSGRSSSAVSTNRIPGCAPEGTDADPLPHDRVTRGLEDPRSPAKNREQGSSSTATPRRRARSSRLVSHTSSATCPSGGLGLRALGRCFEAAFGPNSRAVARFCPG